MDSQIYLCCLNGFMPQKVSYIYEWYPSFKHVNCFAMTETVWGIIFFLKVIRIITFCQNECISTPGRDRYCSVLFRNNSMTESEKEAGESSEKVRRRVGEGSDIIRGYELSDTQKKIVNLLLYERQLSAAKIAEQLGMGSRSIEKNIKKLKELGILIRHGSPKNGYWEVIDCGKKNNEDTE